MRICDRCRCPDPDYCNVYVGNKNRDICKKCYNDYEELRDVFDSIEKNFMSNKNLKHIDFIWEDNK